MTAFGFLAGLLGPAFELNAAAVPLVWDWRGAIAWVRLGGVSLLGGDM
jgi:hypothetical protein